MTTTPLSHPGQAHAQYDNDGLMGPPPSRTRVSTFSLQARTSEVPTRSDCTDRSKAELNLSLFASLFSSAKTVGLDGEATVHASSGPSSLPKFLSSGVVFDESNPQARHSASFPSLSLHNGISSSGMAANLPLQDLAALNLAIPLCASRDGIESIPVKLLENTSKTFKELVDSRLRSSVVALLQQITKLGSAGTKETKTLLKLLSSRQAPVTQTAVVTSFRVLPVPNGNPKEGDGSGGSASFLGRDEPLVLPLVFKAVIDAMVLGKLFTVKFDAPGTITGCFNPADGMIDRVEVAFDTVALLKASIKQARSLVKKAVARAAGLASSVAVDDHGDCTSSSSMSRRGSSSTTLSSSLPSNSSLLGVVHSSSSSSKVGMQRALSSSLSFSQLLASSSSMSNALATLARGGGSRGSFGDHHSSLNRRHHHGPMHNHQEDEFVPPPHGTAATTAMHDGLFSWLKGEGVLLSDPPSEAGHRDGRTPASRSRQKRKQRPKVEVEEPPVVLPSFFASDEGMANLAAMFTAREREEHQEGSSPPPKKRKRSLTEKVRPDKAVVAQ